jgi:hypothetical protein
MGAVAACRAADVDTVHVTFEKQCAPCQVQVFVDDAWQTVAKIEDDLARRTVRRFSPVMTNKLRLLFDEPSSNAAICELRVYFERSHAER